MEYQIIQERTKYTVHWSLYTVHCTLFTVQLWETKSKEQIMKKLHRVRVINESKTKERNIRLFKILAFSGSIFSVNNNNI